mgnify:FL=1
MTAGRQNIWHEVRAVCIFALLYCTLNGAISQGKHTKRSGIMEMRRLQYIQTKQLKSQYLMQLLLCKRRMYNQLYFGRGKPAPLRKARGIVRFWEGWCRARDGEIFHCVGFNSNRFIDRLKPPLRVCNGGFVYRGYFRKPSIIFSSASSLVRPSEQSFNICSPAILPIAAS